MPTTEIAVHTGGALAVGAEQTEWTEQQLAVLRSVGVDKDVLPAELTAFLHESQRTGLDPFTKQIYLIGRKDKQAGRKVFRSQTGIDGYRVVAHRAARRDCVRLSYADNLWCGPDGAWRDVWLSQTPPAAAKVTVYRDGDAFSATATLAEYAARYPDGNPYPMWAKMPATMLAKCAEACALRKAFPQDLAGVYTAEEMEQADARHEPSQAPVLDALERKAQREARSAPADDEFTVEPSAESKKPTTKMAQKLAALVTQKAGTLNDADRHAFTSLYLGREITSWHELTFTDVHLLIGKLEVLDDFIPDAEVVPDSEPLPSQPNPRNGDHTPSPSVAAALATPNLSQLIARAAEANTTVGVLLHATITGAQTPQELERLFAVAVQARDGGHLQADEFTELDQLGRAANEDMANGKTRPPQGWSAQGMAAMEAKAGAPA